MPEREQLPAVELVAVARRTVPGWLNRITVEAARRGGVDATAFADEIATMADDVSARACDELAELLAVDVDEQTTNPLSVLRGAVAAPTELLAARGVPPRPADPFHVERFPDDVYGLGPATWADIHPDLHEPGMLWGAWKAMTVLQRRRDEGLR